MTSIRERINIQLCGDPVEAFDLASALYWHCNDWHEGQWSNRYRILSTLAYRPGALDFGPEPDTYAEAIYDELEGSTDEELADVEAWIWELMEHDLKETDE